MPQTGPELEKPKGLFQSYMKTRLLIGLGAAVVLCVVCALIGVYFAGMSAARKEAEKTSPVITGQLLEERLQTVQKLVSTEYYYTKMGSFEDQKHFHGWNIPFTTKRFIVAYDGVIRAGVDLSQVRVEVGTDRVTVTLPQAAVISHEISEDSIKVYDESNNLLNPIRIEDYTDFTQAQKREMEKEAVEGGLLDSAKGNAVDAVAAFLQLMPELEGYALTVK